MIGEVVTEVVTEGVTEVLGQVAVEGTIEAGTEVLATGEPQNSSLRFWIKLCVMIVVFGCLFLGVGVFTGEWPSW